MSSPAADSHKVPLRPLRPRPRPGTGRRVGPVLLALTVLLGGVTALPAAAAPSDAVSGGSADGSSTGSDGAPRFEAVATRGHTVASQVDLAAPRAQTGGADVAPTGWTTVVDLLPGTQMVALTWDVTRAGAEGAGIGGVSVRPVSDGEPGAWLTRTGEGAGEEGGDRDGSDLIWLGDHADAVEIRVDAGPLVDLRLLRMRYEEGEPEIVPVEEAVQGRTAAGDVAQPTIRPRSDWASGDWRHTYSGCAGGPQVADRLDHVVVHHSAGVNGYTAAQVPGIIDGIYRYHTTGLGWCDIAYNLLIDAYGTIWQGRSGALGAPVVGAHAAGFNTRSMGVSLLGQFQPGATPAAAAPSTAMLDAAARAIAWLLARHDLDPHGTTTVTSGGNGRYAAGTAVTLPVVNVHRDTSYTACPGDNVVARMAALRDAVAARMDDDTTPPPPPPPSMSWTPFATVEDLVWRQYVDVLGHPGTYAARLWWHQALTAGTTNRNALVSGLVNSGEAERRNGSIVRLYLAYFGRVPDHSGIRYWWAQREAGATVRYVSQAFTFSTEFKNRYGALTNTAFVRLVYRNVLGREPDASGLAYWVDQLERGRENRGGVMAQFSESPENKAARDVEVDVIVVHEVMLARAISSPSWATWVDRTRTSGLAPLIGQIFGSAEYAARVG